MSSITKQSFEDQTRRAGCRCENTVFLFVTLGLPARGGHSLNKYCVMGYEWILMLFSPFFERDCPFRSTREFSLSSLGGATIFAKLRSKIAKTPKNQRKSLCAQLRIDSRKILTILPQ